MNQCKMFLKPMLLCLVLSASICFAADEDRNPWLGVFQRGLMLYQEGDYTNTFALVEAAVLEHPPEQEVHRCLALMRKAFLRMHNIREPVNAWTPSALKEIRKRESLSMRTDRHLVILAAVKYQRSQNGDIAPVTVPLLNQIIEMKPESSWKDWAYWEKARVLAGRAWVPTTAWGVVEYGSDSRRRIGCLDDSPLISIPARAAESFLRQKPSTYMGKQMRLDLYLYRTTVARRALAKLAKDQSSSSEKKSDEVLPLEENQMVILREAESKLDALSHSFPKDVLRLLTVEAEIDDFLWNVAESKRVIPEYLKLLQEIRGRGVLLPHVAKWLADLPLLSAVKYEVYEPDK